MTWLDRFLWFLFGASVAGYVAMSWALAQARIMLDWFKEDAEQRQGGD